MSGQPPIRIGECTRAQVGEILAIFNEAIANSTALYDYEPRTMATMETWFESKRAGRFPVLGAFAKDNSLAGFGSYGPFRTWPAYKYSIEHSVYVRADRRRCGIGRTLMQALIAAAVRQDYHMMIGGIDSANAASVRLHRHLGFAHCASIKHAGFKFGRWLDLEFHQLILPTPEHPNEEPAAHS